MTRRHGITETTYDELILDSGAVYTNFVSVDNPGTLLGATRGGAKFTRKPKYENLKYEGSQFDYKGSRFLTGVEVTLEVTILNFNVDNISIAIPNADTTGGNVITESEWDNNAVHTLDNITLIAEMSGYSDPVIIKLENPICDSDFSWDFKDKSEATSTWKFRAFHEEDAVEPGGAPWSITIPEKIPVVVQLYYNNTTHLYSLDNGMTWQSTTSPITLKSEAVAYGNGRFVAINDTGDNTAYSDDGINWTQGGYLPVSGWPWKRLVYGNGTFVCLANNRTQAVYSTDGGLTWSLSNTIPVTKEYYYTLSYGAGRFSAVDYNKGDTAIYSTDGINWSTAAISPNPGFGPIGMAYNGTNFAAALGIFKGFYSSDGINYSLTAAGTPAFVIYTIVAGNGIFVGGRRADNVTAISTDNGLSWSLSNAHPNSGNYPSLEWCGDRFINVKDNGTNVEYSTDGVNWYNTDPPPVSGGVREASMAYGIPSA